MRPCLQRLTLMFVSSLEGNEDFLSSRAEILSKSSSLSWLVEAMADSPEVVGVSTITCSHRASILLVLLLFYGVKFINFIWRTMQFFSSL